VKALFDGKTFSSTIETAVCGDVFCTAKFGYDDILRVQGTGNSVAIYLDSKLYDEYEYAPGTASLITIDVRSAPCDLGEEEDCEAWSGCSGGVQSSFCYVEDLCTGERSNYTQTRSCGGTGSTGSTSDDDDETGGYLPSACVYQWDCTLWSSCVGNQKTRTCTRGDTCDAQFAAGTVPSIVEMPKPAVTNFCIVESAPAVLPDIPSFQDDERTFKPSCYDGILNQGEEKIDCGGPCSPCKKSDILLYIIIGVVALLVLVGIGAGIYFYITSKKVGGSSGGDSGVNQTLRNAYAKGKEKGMTKAQVNQKLIGKGWDPEVLKKFK
jgi:hypothetical protein